jgi:tetratricopeptide (TPR) repeat protein
MRWMAVNAWLIFPLGLLGLAFAAPGAKRTEYLVWASFVPLYAAAVAVFFVAERYRLPLFVPLCIGAGAAVDRAWEWIAERRADALRTDLPEARVSAGRSASIVAAAAVIFAAVNWPVALADSREGDRLRMAVLAAKSGDFDAADRWIARAKSVSTNIARVDEVTSRAFLEEGRSAAQRGAAGVAQAFFRRAVAIRPDLAEAWAQLGFSLLGANQPAEAERALGEAVRLDPRDTVALGGLAIAALNRGDIEAARKHATAALAIDPQETLALRVLAAIPKRF